MSVKAASSFLKQCGHCFKSAGDGHDLSLCSRCQRARYCDAKCQLAAWPSHKARCKGNKLATEHLTNMTQVMKSQLPIGTEIPRHLNPELLLEDLRKWTQKHRGLLGWAIVQALELVDYWGKVHTHAVLFFLDPRIAEEGEDLKAIDRFTINKAEVVTIEHLMTYIGPNYEEFINRRKSNENPKEKIIVPLALVNCRPITQMFSLGHNRDCRPTNQSPDPNWEEKIKKMVTQGESKMLAGVVGDRLAHLYRWSEPPEWQKDQAASSLRRATDVGILGSIELKDAAPSVPAPTTPDSQKCDYCSQLPEAGRQLSRCSRCLRAWYCNATCQKAGWNTHKTVCSPNQRTMEALERQTQAIKAMLPEGLELPHELNPLSVEEDVRAWIQHHNPPLRWAVAQGLHLAESNALAFTHGVVFAIEHRMKFKGKELAVDKRVRVKDIEVITLEEILEKHADSNTGVSLIGHITKCKNDNANPKQLLLSPVTLVARRGLIHAMQIQFPKNLKEAKHDKIDPNWKTTFTKSDRRP